MGDRVGMERRKRAIAWALVLWMSGVCGIGNAGEAPREVPATVMETVERTVDGHAPGSREARVEPGRGMSGLYREEACSEVFPGGAIKGASDSSARPKPLATVVILNDGIEGTWPGTTWAATYGTTATKATWDDTNYLAHGGSWSAWCARGGPDGVDPKDYYYPNNMNAWATFGPFSLADATDASWSFWHWTDTEANYDFFRYMVSIDGTNFHGYQVSGGFRSWTQRTIDLKNLYVLGNVCGRPQVWVAFVFRSDGSTVADGTFVDDIRIEKTTGAGGPIIRISPMSLDFGVGASASSRPPAAPSDKSAVGLAASSAANLASAERLPDGRSLVWLTPKPQTDLTALQQAIEARGGRVVSLAPEGRLLVALEISQTPAFTRHSAVDRVEPFVNQDLGGDPNAGGSPGLGERPPTPDEEKFIQSVYTQVDRVEPNALSVERAKLQGRKLAPASADNSPSQYFPPIRSQGSQGSCAAWASCYYYNTYVQAQDENLTVSGGDNNNICSPAFMYPLINGGVDAGGNTAAVTARLSEVGACCWTLKPYSQGDWTSWPSEAAWIDAFKRRTAASYTFNLLTDAGIAALKQYLANGKVATTRTNVYGNWHPTFHNNEGRGIQNGVLFAHTGETYKGGHAMTIVGYNDNRPYNDGTTTRTGAFLIANSWGNGWGTYNSTGAGSKGFMWVSYDYAKASNSCFDAAYYNDDRDNYRPRLYAVAGLNHAKRGYVTFSGGIGSTGSPAWTSYRPINQDGGTTLSLQDTQRIAVDLTEGISSIADLTNVASFVKYSVSGSAGTNGTITSAQVFQDFDGNGTFASAASADPVVTVAPGQTGYARITLVVTNPNSKTFTIYNDGTADLTVSDIRARDRDAWLSWSPDPNPGPALTIVPGGSRVITVTVDQSRAPYAGNDEQVQVISNDAARSPYPGAVFIGLSMPAEARTWELYR